MRDLDGVSRLGITCALCHAAPLVAGRAFVDGRARRTLDYGLARVALARSLGRPLSDEAEARFSGWGRGRADVLEELSEVPIAIPRPVWSAGAALVDPGGHAAARRPTTSGTRPPRVLAWALVAFLYALEPPPASAPSPDATTLTRGRVLFEAHGRGCHDGPAWSGDPTSLARIETDPELARGRARGTGAYRPAPLLRVRDAAPYLHHGVVPDLASLLSPSREEPGHRFGTDLDETDRAALVAFLETL